MRMDEKRPVRQALPNRKEYYQPSTQANRPVQITHSTKFRVYLQHHVRSAKGSLRDLLNNFGVSSMVMLMIAIALSLPLAFASFWYNSAHMVQSWQESAQMTLFLQKNATAAETDAFLKHIKEDKRVQSFQFHTPEQALQQFQASTGMQDVLRGLPENPLPAVVTLYPALALSEADIKQLLDDLTAKPIVEMAQLDLSWIKRLGALLQVVERALLLVAVVLALGILFVMSNSIRLAVTQRKDEIEVIKLVGANDRYVRRPFLYLGMYYGLGGGLLACVGVSVGSWWLLPHINTLLATYDQQATGWFLPVPVMLCILGGSVMLGWISAWIAVRQQLKNSF